MAPLSTVASEPTQGSVELAVEVDLLANPYTIIVKSLEKKKAKLQIRHAKLVGLREDYIKEPAKLDASQREAILRIEDVVLQIEFTEKLQEEIANSLKDYERAIKQLKVGSKKKESEMQLDLISRFFAYKKILSSLATEELGNYLIADSVISLRELEAFTPLHEIFTAADKCDDIEKSAVSVHCVLTGTGDEIVPGMTGYYAKKVLTKIFLSETYGKYADKIVESPDQVDEENNAEPERNADSSSISQNISSGERLLEKECTLSTITLNSSMRSNCGSGRSCSSPEGEADVSVVDASPGPTPTEGNTEVAPAETQEKPKKRRTRHYRKRPKKITLEDGKPQVNGEMSEACNAQSKPSPRKESSLNFKDGALDKAGTGDSERGSRARDTGAKRIPKRNDDRQCDQLKPTDKSAVESNGITVNKHTDSKCSDSSSKRGQRRPMGQLGSRSKAKNANEGSGARGNSLSAQHRGSRLP